MESLSLQAQADALLWYQTMDLGNGVRTKGHYDPASKRKRYNIPGLTGKSVIDIGAWDGFWSFEAERRGAKRVLATDSFSWTGGPQSPLGPDHWGTKEGFELACKALNSSVEDRTIDVLNLSPEAVGMFDVVFFLGILYHMRNPQEALDRAASVCQELLILETHMDLIPLRRPAMALYRPLELNNDVTNYVGPNVAGTKVMLERAGFKRIIVQPPAGYFSNSAMWAASRLMKRGYRMVFHAYR